MDYPGEDAALTRGRPRLTKGGIRCICIHAAHPQELTYLNLRKLIVERIHAHEQLCNRLDVSTSCQHHDLMMAQV